MKFQEKKMSIKRATSILAKNNIIVDEYEANAILNFLYLIARNYKKYKKNSVDLSGTLNTQNVTR